MPVQIKKRCMRCGIAMDGYEELGYGANPIFYCKYCLADPMLFNRINIWAVKNSNV